MKKFVKRNKVLLIKKKNGFYIWSRDGGVGFRDKAGRGIIHGIYNGTELCGWVLISVKKYYDKIQG